MKKLLLSLLSVAAVAFSSNAAVDPLSIEFTQGSTAYESTSSYSSTWSSTDGNWEFHALNNNKCGWNFIAGGWKTNATEPYFATKTASPAAISSIVATIGDRFTAGVIEKATLLVADNAAFTGATQTDVTSLLPTAKNTDMTIDVANAAAGSYVKVMFSIPKQSANGQVISFAKITINYADNGEVVLKDPQIKWSYQGGLFYEDAIANFKSPVLENPNNLTVTYATSDKNVADVNAEGVVTLTGGLGVAEISAEFAGNDEYKAAKVVCTLTVKPVPATVATVAETVALAANTELAVGYDLTVAYVNGSAVFAYTSTGEYMQLYGTNSYKVGDVIKAGWYAIYSPYNNTPELKPALKTFPVADSNIGADFVPAEVAAADVAAALVNHVIIVKNVVLAEATPATRTNFNGKVGETSLLLRNNFLLESIDAGTYDIVGIVQLYREEVQIYPVEFRTPGGDPVGPSVPKADSIKETLAMTANTDFIVNYDMTVGFVFNRNIFACDAAGDFMQIYAANEYKVGDVIPAGWTAQFSVYNSAPQLKPVDALPAATAGSFTAKEVAASDISNDLVNNVVVLKNVVFAEATPEAKANFTGKVGEVELSFRNNYSVASVAAGTYDVTIVVTVYNNAPSLYVISYAPAQTSGIDEIEAAAAEAVYYNLQGVRVENPENGIFIVRRGDKVTKEVIR